MGAKITLILIIYGERKHWYIYISVSCCGMFIDNFSVQWLF